MARLELLAIPLYYATMGAEYVHHRRRGERGVHTDGDYELRDTATSLAMGFTSLIVPLVAPKILDPITPGKGKYAKHFVGATIAAAAVTTVADAIVRATDDPPDVENSESPQGPERVQRRRLNRAARRVARYGGVASVSGAVVAASAAWNRVIRIDNMWRRRIIPDLGTGVIAWGTAILGWDLLYYVNHRLWHSTRFMWANHVVHHSSEHYNLSTALRQAVSDPLLLLVPYSGLSLLGVRPELVATSRSINLLYQYWVHTDAIDRVGPFEEFMSTPSHHRVHHASDKRYIDRNHGGILIVFDRLFGTFTREEETPTYGLTKNIDTFNPWRVATHEYADILRDIADSDNWTDRLSFTFRGPGWAYEQHRLRAAPALA